MRKRTSSVRKRVFKWLGIAFLVTFFVSLVALGGAYYYKSDILLAVNQEINKNVNGDVSIGDITFSLWDKYPGLSITLHDTYLRGSYYTKYRTDFFKAKKVHISLRLIPLLRKTLVVRSIRVTDASISIYRTRLGESNLDVFKVKKVHDTTTMSKTPMSVMLSRLYLEDVTLSYRDSLKKKSFGFHFIDLRCQIEQKDSSRTAIVDGPVKFDGLMFNPALGSYLKQKSADVKLNLELKSGAKNLVIRPSILRLEKSSINLSGAFDFEKPGNFILHVGSDELVYHEGVSVLTEALQSKLAAIRIEKPVEVRAQIVGQLTPGNQPEVDVSFKLKNTNLEAYRIHAGNVTTSGSFSNHFDNKRPNDDANSVVKLESFEGEFQGLPTRLVATVRNLKDPTLQINTTLDIAIKDLKTLVDPSQIKFGAGRFSSRIEYSGKIREFLDTTKTKLEGRLSGSAQLLDGSISYQPRRDLYEKVNLSMHFDEKHVGIENISFFINKSPVTLKGELLGFVPFFILPGESAEGILSVYSPSFNIQSLMNKGPAAKKARAVIKQQKSMVTLLIDKLLETVKFELNVNFDRLMYGKMNATRLNGKFILKNYAIEAQNVNMGLADGTIALSMGLSNLQNPVSSMWIRSSVRHADIKKFFYSFDNFKLTAITWENLEGKIDMQSFVRSQVDDKFNLMIPTMVGNLDLVLKKGKLINFEPLENMSNFLFKKRDFSNVEFGEIRSHIRIRGREFDISKMEVESTVLRLFVEGQYSLTGHTDLSVQIPLSNLKKRDKDYKPENVGVDKKVGMSVFLHVHNDEQGKTVIAYDPFKKHVKKSPSKAKASSKSVKR